MAISLLGNLFRDHCRSIAKPINLRDVKMAQNSWKFYTSKILLR